MAAKKDLASLRANADSLAEKSRKKALQALNYIEMLANTTRTDISDWNIVEVFGKGKGNELQSTRPALNKAFFEYLGRVKEEQKAEQQESTQLSETTLKVIDKAARAAKTGTQANLQQQYKQALETIRSEQRYVDEALTRAWNIQKQLLAEDEKNGNENYFSSQIEEILKGNFWEFKKFQGGTLFLVTKGDVLCRWHRSRRKNINDGETEHVNLGMFEARLHLSDMRLDVVGCGNNTQTHECIHPYIGRGGNMCWGNAGHTANSFRASGQIANLMKLLSSLLLNYYDTTTPMCRMQYFVAEQAKQKPKKKRATKKKATKKKATKKVTKKKTTRRKTGGT